MKFKQALKDIKKPKDITQNILHEYLCELYGNSSFAQEDESYVDNSSPEAVNAYKERVNLLIDKLVDLSNNQKFLLLKEQFNKDVSAGETRITLDEVKKTAEAMCYKLSNGQVSSPEKFKAEAKNATLNACEAGLLTNMQKILYSMDNSLYAAKYIYIHNMAAEYVRSNRLSSPQNEVHVGNELIHEVSQIYNVTPPRDIHARYRDLSMNAHEDFAKHVEFPRILDEHLATRIGVYSFVESMENTYSSNLPDAAQNKKFVVKAAGTNNDSSDLEQIICLADDLNIPITSIIQYSEDGKEFEYQTDYMSVIKFAIIQELHTQDFIDHDPLIIKRTETVRTYASPKVIKEEGKPTRVIRDTIGTEETKIVQQAVIESPDGWFLAERIGDRVTQGEKLLDTSHLQKLTIEEQDIEDYLHIRLKDSLEQGINFEDSLRSLVEENGINQEDLVRGLFLLSDQSKGLISTFSEEELFSMSIEDIKNWNNFIKLLETNSTEALDYIVQYGDEKMLDKYLESNEDVSNWRDNNQNTLLHIIADKNVNLKIIDRLITLGVNIDAVNREGDTPLHLAIKLGNNEVTNKLIAAGANKEAKSGHGFTPLHMAAITGNDHAIYQLIAAGANKEAKDRINLTPLHIATLGGNSQAISTLITLGADKEARNMVGETSLCMAVNEDKIDAISTLFTLGANKEDINSDGDTVLYYAAKENKDIAPLIALGADINAKNKYGYPPLVQAIISREPEIINKLIEAGADINAKDNNGNTSLDLAVIMGGDNQLINKLIEAGADIHAKNKHGLTALHLFSGLRKNTGIDILIEAGADINAKDNNGKTPLHYAVEENKDIEPLIALGADINAKDNNGRTSLDLAIEVGKDDIVKKLIEAEIHLINNIISQGSGYIQDNPSIWKLVEGIVKDLPKNNRVEIVSAALESIDNTSRRDRLLSFLPEEERNVASAKVPPTMWQEVRETIQLMHGNSSVDVPSRKPRTRLNISGSKTRGG